MEEATGGEMHPILLELGPVAVGSYGTMVLVGLLCGILLLPRYARREGIEVGVAVQSALFVFAAGALGCRLLHVVLRLPEVLEDPRLGLWLLQQAGIWYGAIIGGLAAGVVVARAWRLPIWSYLDMAAVPVVVGGGVGRLGCLLSGCCWGRPTSLPWGIRYDNELSHRLHPDLPYGTVHPVPIYELVLTLVIAFVLDRAGVRGRRPAGEVGLLWLVLYGVGRAGLELLRGDAARGEVVRGLSTSQGIGLVVAAIAGALLVVRRRLG